MSCHKINNGIVCLANIYKYKGFIFEWHYWCGPMKLRKNFEPYERQGRKFYKVATEWNNISEKQKEKTRIYG
jgi:hypothetical protein